MKLLLEIKENKAEMLLALLRDLPYVKIKTMSDNETRFLLELQESIEELNQIKSSKSKGRPIADLLNEL
ncbi:MAG TPA: hypothetical protein VKZ78_07030 [Sphingobacteriaceae bacterium]|jgi:hypothetical protein|nr:hypothetical protein [Sphingobacteriaceae bacterium]